MVLVLGGFKPQAPAVNYCNLYGRIYLSEQQQGTYLSVYFEEYENMGDLEVFVWENALMADHSGMWCFVEDPYQADYILYKEENRQRADLRVHLTDIESLAGCR